MTEDQFENHRDYTRWAIKDREREIKALCKRIDDLERNIERWQDNCLHPEISLVPGDAMACKDCGKTCVDRWLAISDKAALDDGRVPQW